MPNKAKTLTQIAEEYGVHLTTLIRWIKPIKNEVYEGKRKLLLPRQYKKIYKFLGEPDFDGSFDDR
jgi:hypothetical protein